MKMKEFGPQGGRASLAPPLRSANADDGVFHKLDEISNIDIDGLSKWLWKNSAIRTDLKIQSNSLPLSYSEMC